MNPEKEKKILGQLADEERAARRLLEPIRARVFEYLVAQKGYLETDIEIDPVLDVTNGKKMESCSIDFIVSAGGVRLIAVKCAPAALESRQRHVLAFSRVAGQIPFSVVTDSLEAAVISTGSGKIISTELSGIPEKARAAEMAAEFKAEKLGAEKLMRESCILLAFNSISCAIAGGGPE